MRRLALVLLLVVSAASLAGCGLCFKDPLHPQSMKR
jgi:hypothetical protein